MSLARIKRSTGAAEAACNAVLANPANRELRDQLFDALAQIAARSFAPTDGQSAEIVGLCKQARVWAEIVRERLVFARNFVRTTGRAASDFGGLTYNIHELLRVLGNVKDSVDADD